MTTPQVRHGTVRIPNGGNPNVRWKQAEDAARQDAKLTLADGEMVVDLQVEGGTAERGNDAVMVYSYSYQVLKPGASGWSARLR